MGLRTYSINLSELKTKESIRLWIPYILPQSRYKFDKINNFLSLCESGTRPKGGIQSEDEDEAISLGGEQIGSDGCLNLAKIPCVSFDFFHNTYKGKVKDNDILICKDGALTGKTCLVDFSIFTTKEVMVNEHVFILRSNEKINQKFLYYLTKTNIFQSQIKDLAYKKKAQPGLNLDHFKRIKIPLIELGVQETILKRVECVENRISNLKDIILPDEIINRVFSRAFNFDIVTFEKLKKIKNFELDFFALSNNKDIRQSVKFHRNAGIFVFNQLKKLSKKKIKDFLSEPIVLGVSISPEDYDEDGVFFYISMADIKNWKFEAENCYSVKHEYSNQNKNKTVSRNDILIARSGEGTIGKVALIEESIKGIFADFMMRVRLINYNPYFAYFYFRTVFFQYLIEINKKGLGNNTNIFPSQIQELPMIDISLEEQQKIVDEIKYEIDKQEAIKKQIHQEKMKIIQIIESAIM